MPFENNWNRRDLLRSFAATPIVPEFVDQNSDRVNDLSTGTSSILGFRNSPTMRKDSSFTHSQKEYLFPPKTPIRGKILNIRHLRKCQ